MYIKLAVAILLLDGILYSDQSCLRYAGDGNCRECAPGYVGKDCSRTCRYPNYGPGCQDVCHCVQSACIPISGCSQGTDCRPGYFGHNCAHECRYPNYGVNCQYYCSCPSNLCDKKVGCDLIRGEKKQMTLSNWYKLTEKVQSFYTDIKEIQLQESFPLSKKPKKLSTPASTLLTIKIDQDMLSLGPSKQDLKTTNTMPVIHNTKSSVFSNLYNLLILGVITVGLLLFITMCVIMFKLHRKSTFSSMRGGENQENCMHYKPSSERLVPGEYDEVSHNSNEISMNTGTYETIDTHSDDSDGTLTETPNDIISHQQRTAILTSHAELAQDGHMDDYLYPNVINRNKQTSNRDTRDEKYLTIL